VFKRNSLTFFSSLPLLLLLVSSAHACHSTESKNSSVRNENRSVSANSTAPQEHHVKGIWGGQSIRMEVTDEDARITYDCAHGSITEKIVPDAEGHFTVHGRHVRQSPGPTREGEDSNGQPATYRGTVSGDTMTLTVTLSESKETVGTFSLKQGSSGRIRRCL
jgi:hypothetical protein